MKLPERLNKEYRLLALAVVFFLAGIIFFWYDAALPSRSPSPSALSVPSTPAAGSSQTTFVQPANSAGGQQQGQQLDPDFAKFPPPSQFKTFAYDAGGLNGSTTLPIATTCHDAYVAVLIFPAAIDYRGDINAAAYNEAFPCHLDQPFALTIATSDIAPAPFGSYYLIVADEGKNGTWYNPR